MSCRCVSIQHLEYDDIFPLRDKVTPVVLEHAQSRFGVNSMTTDLWQTPTDGPELPEHREADLSS